MKEEKSTVCRLCLNLLKTESYTIIDDVKKQMLDIVLPEMSISLTSPAVMCNDCAEILQKSYDFRSNYLNRRNIKMEIIDENYGKYCIICRLHHESSQSVGDNVLLKHTLETCLPELPIVDEGIVCETCTELLYCQYNFVTKSSEIEEILQQYSKTFGTVDLFNVLQSERTVNKNVQACKDRQVYIKHENAEDDNYYELNSESINTEIEYSAERENLPSVDNKDGTRSTLLKQQSLELYNTWPMDTIKLESVKGITEDEIKSESVVRKSDNDNEINGLYNTIPITIVMPQKKAKTGAQRTREYRERKKIRQGLIGGSVKQPPKTGAQRNREYRARKKMLQAALEAQNLINRSTSNLTEYTESVRNNNSLSEPNMFEAICSGQQNFADYISNKEQLSDNTLIAIQASRRSLKSSVIRGNEVILRRRAPKAKKLPKTGAECD